MRYRFDDTTGEFIPVQDDRGREIPDPTPIAMPVRTKRPLPLADQVARLVRSDLWNQALADDAETFAEADDFDVDDDFDPNTPYEVEFDPVLGKEIAPADFSDPVKRDYWREQYLLAEKNAMRAEERQRAIDEAWRRRFRGAGGAGVKGAPPPSEPEKK